MYSPEAMTMANRIVLMRNGIVQQVADPDTMFEQPANAFVAGFVGSPAMNFFQSKLTQGPDRPVVEFGGAALPVQLAPDVFTRYADKTVLVGLRPEHMSLGNGTHSTVVQPNLVESLGSERYIYFPVPEANTDGDTAFAKTRFPGRPFYFGKPWFMPIADRVFARRDRADYRRAGL